jgi:hypothetical protein
MTTKPKIKTPSDDAPAERKTFWRPPAQRNVVSDSGRRWQEENAEAIKGWKEYIEKNGLPLDEYRQF